LNLYLPLRPTPFFPPLGLSRRQFCHVTFFLSVICPWFRRFPSPLSFWQQSTLHFPFSLTSRTVHSSGTLVLGCGHVNGGISSQPLFCQGAKVTPSYFFPFPEADCVPTRFCLPITHLTHLPRGQPVRYISFFHHVTRDKYPPQTRILPVRRLLAGRFRRLTLTLFLFPPTL